MTPGELLLGLMALLLLRQTLSYRRRWLSDRSSATTAGRALATEKARCRSMEGQLNAFILRAHAAESKLEELWLEHCEASQRPAVLRDPVKLTDEEAHRVMLILFPERRFGASGRKVQ